jgi:heptaprenyl diphosphate synthase
MTDLGRICPDPTLRASLEQGLVQVEDALHEAIRSDYLFATEASGHLVDAGGKRFRPLLTLLAAHLGPAPAHPHVIKAATVVELTHLATLYHDDVMDEASLRRGAPSANARWDNTIAILTGDFLFSRASDILADLGPEAVRIQARTFERLCTGQIRETVGPDDGIDPIKHHLQVLADKTGSLIATSGRFGAMMAGANLDTIDAVTRYGEAIGIAFQIADDIVDITSDATQSGKVPGTDLREGIPTLAALHALDGDDPDDAELRALLQRPLDDDDDHARALTLLRQHQALREARAEAQRWASDARHALKGIAPSAATDTLNALCDYVVDRTS